MLSGENQNICHPSSCIPEPARRNPSSVFFDNRFRSADCQKIQLFNFGMIATGNHNFERFAALCNTPGGSQELKSLWSLPFNVLLSCVGFGSPSWRPLQGAAEIIGLQQPTGYTPSVSPFGLTAPSGREPRRLCRSGRPSLPYCKNAKAINARISYRH